MSDETKYPSQPWQLIPAVLLTMAALIGSLYLWTPHLPLLQREYLASYVCLSLSLPRLHAQEVIVNGNHLAELQESGAFHRETRTVKDPASFQLWLQNHIYEGEAAWQFLLVPELLTLLIGIPALGFAMVHYQHAEQEARGGRLLRGPRVISNWKFYWRTRFQKRGFYIEVK